MTQAQTKGKQFAVQSSMFFAFLSAMMKTDDSKVPIGIRWTSLLLKYRYTVLAFWFCIIWPCGLIGTPRFLDNTVSLSSIFPEIKKSKASPKEVLLKSRGMQQYAFHMILEHDDSDSSATLIDGHSMIYNSTRSYVLDIERRLQRYWQDKYNFSQGPDKDFDINVASYYTFYERGLKVLAKETFVTNGGMSTLVSVDMPVRKAVPRKDLEAAATQVCTENTPLGVSVAWASWDSLESEAMAGADNDAKIVHYVSAPLAAIVLILSLGSLQLLLVPLLTMATTFLGTSAIMAIISTRVQVWDLAPALMGSTTAALSIDYCLFLLSRFLEERKTLGSIDYSIQEAVQHSGHTILVSGLVLSGCCLGYLLLPFHIQATFGIAFPVLIIVSLCVNLTLVPVLLHVMFVKAQCQSSRLGLFGALAGHPVCKRSLSLTPPEVNTTKLASKGAHTDVDDCLGTMTFAFSKRIVQPKFGAVALVAVTVLMMSTTFNVRHMKTGFSSNLTFPRNGQSLQAFNRIGELFGFGIVYENEIWFVTPESDQPISTRTRFETIHSVLEELTGDQFPATPTIDHYASITTLGGRAVPLKKYQEALKCGQSCRRESLKTIALLSDAVFDFAGHDATRTMVMLNIDPTSNEGGKWIDKARSKLEFLKLSGKMGDLDYLQSGVPELYLANTATLQRFPIQVATAFLVVFLLMGVFFGSVVIPFLSLLSVLLTQGFVYGAAVCVYQYGFLNFLGVPGLSSDGAGEIHFFIPIMTFTLVLGLGLDYDTFVIGRVVEYRELGFTHESAIVLALCKTRKVITAAGLIMAVSFGGLLLSEAAFVNQFAFLMVSAVLMDTFVVRTTILPIFLGMFGERAFWPRRFPNPTMCIMNGCDLRKVDTTTNEDDSFKLLVVNGTGGEEDTWR